MSVVATARGDLKVSDLGSVLPHEHLFINMLRERRADGLVNDEDLVARELAAWARPAGATVLDLTTAELTPGSTPHAGGTEDGWTRSASNVAAIQRVSARTGVHVILGTGHYRDPYLDKDRFDRLGVDVIAEELVRDLEEGFPGTDVRAGLIGEVGSDAWYISCAEERSLRAAARAHLRTNAAIYTHAARWQVGLQQLDVLEHEGIDPARVAVGHCDTVPVAGYLEQVASRGAYVGLDTINSSHPEILDSAVAKVMRLVRAGHLRQILLSHDVCLSSHLQAFGGNGFALVNGTLRLKLLDAGLDDEEFRVITTENPAALLTG